MKRVFTIFVAVVCAALVFSCDKADEANLPTATITADEAFVDGKASITITLSAAAPVDVVATIACGSAREGKTAIDPQDLKFDDKVTLKAGEKSATCTVELVSTKNIAVGAEAAIALAGITAGDFGALKCDVNIAYITYNGYSYGEGGSIDTGSLSVQSNWSASLIDTPYVYKGKTYQDVEVKADDIAYYWLDAYTDEQLKATYGSVENMVKEWESVNLEDLQDGSGLSDILFANDDEVAYVSYPGAGAAKIYLVEFDQNGKSTGRIGISNVVFEEFENKPANYSIGVPESFTKVASLSVEYNGRYTDEYEDEDTGEMVSEDLDVFSVVGAGDEYYWLLCVEEKGVITDVAAYAKKTAQVVEEYFEYIIEEYAWFYEWAGVEPDITDILNCGTFEDEGYDEYYAMENGDYDGIVFLIDEDCNMTGEYGMNTVTIDGHAVEWPEGFDDDESYYIAPSMRKAKIHRAKLPVRLERKVRK